MRRVAAMMVLLAAAAQPAAARPPAPAFIPMGAVADAPNGFTAMCAVGDAACRTPLSTAAPAAAMTAPSRVTLKLVNRINRAVNRRVAQRSDQEVFRTDELWRAAGAGADAVGDCEDIALEKRAELLASGLEADRLLLATAHVEGLGLHTVLIARLPDGDYVLDSLGPWVLRWNQVRYSWLRVQAPGRPAEWRRIERGIERV